MKFLVTGGAGFIGHNVVQQLEALGHECLIFDSKTNYGIIDNDELRGLVSERLSLVQSPIYTGDICYAPLLEREFVRFQPDVVIHLASFPRQRVVNERPAHGSEVMMTGLINVLEASKKSGVKRVVYVSSSMVYGAFEDGVKEDEECFPQGLYGIMKLAGEDICRDYARRGVFDVTVVRPSAVYGPRDVTDRVVSKWIEAAIRGEVLKVNGANERLDFTYVTDAARGIVLASTVDAAANRTYNISRGYARPLAAAANMIIDIVGSGTVDIRSRDDEFPSRGSLDISCAQWELGYSPTTDIEVGFIKYVQHVRHTVR